MRRFVWFFAALSSVARFAGTVQAQDTLELFGGYSYLRASVPVTETIVCPAGTAPDCPVTTSKVHPNLNGSEVSGAVHATSWVGVVADLGAHYGTSLGALVHLQPHLFGPQVRLPGRVSAFGRVLVGGPRETIAITQQVFRAGTPNSLAAPAGAVLPF